MIEGILIVRLDAPAVLHVIDIEIQFSLEQVDLSFGSRHLFLQGCFLQDQIKLESRDVNTMRLVSDRIPRYSPVEEGLVKLTSSPGC